MARKAREAVLPAAPEVDQEAVRQDIEVLDAATVAEIVADDAQATRVRAVALQVGYLLPADCADPDLIQRDIAANMRRSVEAVLEVGRGLIVLKEASPYGTFIPRLEALGIEQSVARRLMQSAHKFSNRALTHDLKKAIGNQQKLFELLILDDDQIDELCETGETLGLALDEIDRMGTSELRRKLREARADAEAKDKLLSDKNAKLDALVTRAVEPWDEKVAAFKAEISAGFDVLDDAVGKLSLVHGVILDSEVTWGGSEEAERVILRQFAVLYGDRLNRLLQQFAELRDHYEVALSGWASELDGREIAPAGAAD
ncbi:MAG: hypothetical protein KDH15_21570 [Rhodocyclaceae bacterium]|nr:hypothetical protein [Rhodocyclaceae bacterium]